jgi:hypothetical protein
MQYSVFEARLALQQKTFELPEEVVARGLEMLRTWDMQRAPLLGALQELVQVIQR